MREGGNFSFLIVAGGSGSRIGGLGKQFRALGRERSPLWRWSADLALRAGVGEIVLILPAEQMENTAADFARAGTAFLQNKEPPPSSMGVAVPAGYFDSSVPVRLAQGGATRTESVRNGLAVASRDYAMVHDAARPFVSERLLRRLMESVTPVIGAAPVMPVSEALKRVEGTGTVSAVERDGLYATQTPQVFHRDTLVKILGERLELSFKDEAEAWLSAGLELRCVEGERLNFKVTWPEDLELAEALVEKRERQENIIVEEPLVNNETNAKNENPEETSLTRSDPHTGQGAMPLAGLGAAPLVRVGIGYDVHRLTPERPLVLGGVRVPSPLGLLGHSDADVLAHAAADAILGAAGLPDIGNLFPASDDKYKDADSMELLRQAASLVKAGGWEITWLDAVLEAQVPRLNAFLPEMAERMSAVLNPDAPLCVNLKAKSPERTGDPGMARSMTCRAAATLCKSGILSKTGGE